VSTDTPYLYKSAAVTVMKNKSPLGQQLLLIFVGLLVSILLAEMLFRIGGVIANQRIVEPAKSIQNTDVRILCVGDSSTYGLGASNTDKFSYPAQLQTLLNERGKHKKFDVINLGVPGINSSQTLHRFRDNLIRYKPDIAIVMVGINDPWNLEENNILQGHDENIFRRGFLAFEELLNTSRVFQFFKLTYISGTFHRQELILPDFDDNTKSRGFQYSQENYERANALYTAIANNIIKIKQIAEDQHVVIIFMKYHNSGWGSPETIINETYLNLNVPVVDQFSVFKKAKELGFKVRGKDGWHPNDFGYFLMTRNIFNKLIELKFIESEPVEIIPSNFSEVENIEQVIGDGIGFYDWETWGGGEIPEWPDNPPARFRWTRAQASMSINEKPDKGIKLFLFATNPDINRNPLRVKITGDNGLTKEEIFTEQRWEKIVISRDALKGLKLLSLQADRTWNPKAYGISDDSRDLGVIVAISAR